MVLCYFKVGSHKVLFYPSADLLELNITITKKQQYPFS